MEVEKFGRGTLKKEKADGGGGSRRVCFQERGASSSVRMFLTTHVSSYCSNARVLVDRQRRICKRLT